MNRVIPVSLVVLLLTICACSIFTPQTGEPRISFIPTGVPETFFTPERTGMFSGINDGSLALQYLKELSHFGSRALNEPGHARASEYIENSLMRLGYSPVKQNFVTSNELPALNLLVDKAGQSSQVILIGAHYDSVNTGSGIDDNGSGVAILLEMANRLKDKETPYSLRFVFLDAEETGLEGSKYYVSQMSQDDIQNTLAMINLDSLAVGDHTYIYGNEGDEGAIRDWALDYAARQGFDLITQPGLNPEYPAGTTLDESDHAPFLHAGIQYAYFEATNWALGEMDGYTQVDTGYGEEGEIWHTEYDSLEYIVKTFPGRMESHLKLFSNVLFHILTDYQG